MNKVTKSDKVPSILIDKGTKEIVLLRESVAENEPLVFNAQIYAADEVKKQLKSDQFGKCAYCERSLNGDFGAVEHFRPKGGYQIEDEKYLRKPGYYWLAYDWNNLLYSCSECNTSYKRNFFPLANENQRDIEHENITKEEPLLLNPATDEIGDYIEFHRHLVAVKDTAPFKNKAVKTIELFKLNDRSVLKASRLKVWNQYENYCKMRKIAILKGNNELLGLVNVSISKLTAEDAEFTGMFKYQRK